MLKEKINGDADLVKKYSNLRETMSKNGARGTMRVSCVQDTGGDLSPELEARYLMII